MPRLHPSSLCLAVIAAASLAPQALADVKLPSVIGSHMVLQRDATVPIWGWADPGEEVTVTLGDQKRSARPGDDGRWQVQFKGLTAGGPHTLIVAGKNEIALEDILVGEVWVCSGQSNMEWSVAASDNPQQEIAEAQFPNIRLFHVPRRASTQPLEDVVAEWKACSPQTVGTFSGVAYFFGRHLHRELDVPIGLIEVAWGGTRIEPWTPPVGFAGNDKLADVAQRAAEIARMDPGAQVNQQQPTVLYNGMVKGVVPLGIRGAIWYQGESNRGEGMLYFEKMRALIGGWREVWNQGDFPFLFVQLAPFAYNGSPTALPEIWEAQTAALKKIPNTGMAVTVDIGNVKDIHPRNKQDVGKRLALWALARTYGKKDLVYSGPIYKGMAVEESGVRITFDHVEGGLISRDGKPLSHFQIAGEDKQFVPAQAKIEGDSVIVSSPDVARPVAVRFGWDQLAEPNLANKAGLPASPFRTDNW